MEELTGIIVIDKPQGITSTKVVEKIRRLLKVKKAGHLGTLDPMATGVLPIAVGRATKLSDVFMSLPKEYVGRVKLGVLTDTYDRDGRVIEEKAIPEISPEKIEEVLKRFTGEIEQIPPMFSAKRYKGKRLYELAREGKEVEREPKRVFVHEIRLISYDPPFLKLYMKVGKGVYVRSLAKDIAEALGTVGTLWDLARTAACGFTMDQAVSLDELSEMELEERRKLVIPLSETLTHLPVLRVVGRLKWWVSVGNAVVVTPQDLGVDRIEEGQLVKILGENREFVALGEVKRLSDGRWICHPKKVLYTA